MNTRLLCYKTHNSSILLDSLNRHLSVLLLLLMIAGLLICSSMVSGAAVFVQQNSATPQSPQSSVSVKYNAGQTIGNTNVLVIGWNDTTANITSVADSSGNVYQVAVPTFRGNGLSQAIYYAVGIKGAAAGSNTVTVTFNKTAVFVDLRIAEYSGLAPTSPFDVGTSATSASGGTANSGSVSTSANNEVLIGAGITIGVFNGAGAGFTQRVITSPDGDILEDRSVSAIGSYSATAPVDGAWVMQIAAFKTAGATSDTTPPTVSVTSPINGSFALGTVSVSATAADNAGVAGVQFLLDGTNLGAEDTTSPYSVSWNTTSSSNGSHTLSARARDAAGNSATSTPVTVTVDNQAPTGTVLINNGAAATNVTAVTLNLSATDSQGPVTQMRFSDTGTSFNAPVAYAATAPWTLTMGAGTNTVFAQFKDAAGNWSASATDTIVLDTTAPTVSNLAAMNITANSATITWTTNEAADSQADYGLTTGYGATTTLDSNLVISHSVPISGLNPGTTYHYRVRSRDAAGNLTVSADSTLTTVLVSDTTPPSTPANLSASPISQTQINLTWNASTDNVGVTGYRVFRDGAEIATTTLLSYQNTGLTSSTTYSYAVLAFDGAGNSSALSQSVSATTFGLSSLGLLRANPLNPHYFTDGTGRAVYLTGSHTWNDLQDWGTGGTVQPFDFTAYVNMLVTHGHNFTLLWRTELPKFCGLPTRAVTDFTTNGQPWQRTGPGTASDGGLKFDLTKFDQSFFDRLRSRVQQLNASGIYTGVYLFTGEWIEDFRCSGDGFPLTGSNNINGINDGGGTGSVTMTAPNAITAVQDGFVDKMIDTLNDLPNVLWIVSEEAPASSTWWNDHLISHIRANEAGKPLQHPIGYAVRSDSNDASIYNSDADWVAPSVFISPTTTCGSGTPTCKVNINDSDHSYFGMWNSSAQANRNFFWQNFATGNQTLFMDPYVVYYPRENRNLCTSPVNGICSAPDARWNNVRDTMGYIRSYANRMNLVAMTPQASLFSSGFGLANTNTSNAEYLAYLPNGGSINVNLSTTPGTFTVEWFNPSNGAVTTSASVTGGASRSFAAPFSGDAVLYLKLVPSQPDTTPPSIPTNLSANPVSSSQINLSWTASTDNVAVSGYNVFRGGTQIATVTLTSFSDTGLAPNTSYTYAVRAFDTSLNFSALSPNVSASTLAPDTVPPAVSITNPGANSTVSGTVVVTANASDNVGVSGVQFLLDGSNLGTEDTTAPYSVSWDTFASSNATHTLSARARDTSGNMTTASVSVTVSNMQGAGLTAGYAFDDGAGTIATDASGNNLNGTLTNGPTWTTGRFGGAINLDGSNDFVELGNPTLLQITGSMTISAWIYSTAFPVDDAAIVSKRGSNGGYQLDTTIDQGPRGIGFKLTSSAGSSMIRYGATAMQANTWYHVAGSYNASSQTMHVYLNGVLDDGALVGTVTSSQQNSTLNVNIGRRAGNTGFEFAGRVDDVRIYSRALTQAEIQSDLNTPLGTGTSSDPTPPTVSISSPTAGTQVSNIVTVTADAFDNVGVAGVQFYVDGAPTGAEDITSPYGFNWDTRTSGNGGHTLTARARDASGNTTLSAPVAVNVANANFFQNEVLATGFNLPTAVKFLPDGRLLVVELAGTIKVLPPPYTTPDPAPFLRLTNVGSAGVQQGIYEITLDPNFASNHFYYIFYTAGSPNHDRLSRFTANATLDGTVPGSEFVLYEDPQNANAEHHGGAINFGNDGKIYFTTGEHFNAVDAQLLTSPRGKLHRINPDGSVPTDNPFYDGSGPNWDSIWAIGLRNPYRAYFDAPTNRLYIGDVGGNDYSTAQEEVDVAIRGANYGWPNCELGTCGNPNNTAAIYAYPHLGRDASITGGFVYHGSQYPASYQGSYFFADYTQNWIRRLTFDAQGNVNGVFNFEPVDGSVDGPYGDIVYLTEGPDGALYYVDLGYSDISGQFGISKIRRIRYVQSNLPPTAIASASPVQGPAPLTVNFSSAGSSDPEGHPLTYLWTFGDGATSTTANPVHTYAAAGQYAARLTVSDGVNNTIGSPITLSVGNPPTPTIFSPTDGTLFVAGDVISFSGNATDTEDGVLPASSFTWNIDFLHEGHVHPGIPITGVKSGTFTIPTSGHDFSGFTRYRILLTVVDSNGLQASSSTTILPRKVNLSFATAPAGLTLYLDGIAKTTPFVYDTLTNFQHTIEARNQGTTTTTYTFASWSDGGTQTHTITVPSSAQSYVATYNATSGTPTTMGETTIFGGNDNGNGNLLLVQDATLSQGATMQSLSFYVTAASGNLRLGIYDATGPGGGPGTLKAETNAFAPVVGWNTANVITPVFLPAGNYWLAYLPSSNSLNFAANFSIGSYKFAAVNFGPMPVTFPAITGQGTTHWSFYGTLSP